MFVGQGTRVGTSHRFRDSAALPLQFEMLVNGERVHPRPVGGMSGGIMTSDGGTVA